MVPMSSRPRLVGLAALVFQAAALRHGLDASESLEQSPQAYPGLCDPQLVADACDAMNGGNDSGLFVDDVSMQSMLSATKNNLEELWNFLQLPTDLPAVASGGIHRVHCGQLCVKIKDYFIHEGTCPRTSDAACYRGATGELQCDLNLSPLSLRDMTRFEGDLPDFRDGPQLELSKSWRATQPRSRARGLEREEAKMEIDYNLGVMLRRVANLFRIYPADSSREYSDTDMAPSWAPTSFFEEASIDPKFERWVDSCDDVHGATARLHGSLWSPKSCKCNEGEELSRACGRQAGHRKFDYRVSDLRDTRCRCQSIGSGDRDAFCAPSCYDDNTLGSCDKLYCSKCSWCLGSQNSIPRPSPPPSLDAADAPAAACDDTCTAEDCSKEFCFGCPICNWREGVEKRSQEAQAYVDTAIARFSASQTEKQMATWFGENAYRDSMRRSRLKLILNSIVLMLGNVDYVFPGPDCQENVYAYVYPRGPNSQDAEGRYLFYLCELYMHSPPSVQIETLTHEGSHHATAYTDDVDFTDDNGVTHKAYGRSICKRLAKKEPRKAVENADNICYYIQDITDDQRGYRGASRYQTVEPPTGRTPTRPGGTAVDPADLLLPTTTTTTTEAIEDIPIRRQTM